MHLHHEAVLEADLATVWPRAKDCRALAAAFPGGSITESTADGFTGEVSVGMGLVRLTFVGAGRYVEVDDDRHRAVISATGRQRRGPGRAGIRMTLHLTDLGASRTEASLDTELNVNGTALPLAGPIGERVAAPLAAAFLRRLAGPTRG